MEKNLELAKSCNAHWGFRYWPYLKTIHLISVSNTYF